MCVRKSYLDNIRWITIVLVVLYHVLYMYNGVGVAGGFGKITTLETQYYDVFLYAVYPWFMLLLFLVSGMCARFFLERHTDGEFIRTRTRKLLVPSTIGLFVFQFLQGYVNMALSGAFESSEIPGFVLYPIMVLSGVGVLWYIQLLWVFSLLLVLLRKIEKDRLWRLGGKTNEIALVLFGVLIWGAAQILNTPVVIVYRFGFYGVAFLLGYYVFSHDEVIDRLKKWWIPLTVIAVGLGVAFCIVYFGGNYADAPINRSPLFTSFAWFMSLAILGVMAKYGNGSNAFTQWMSKRSFGLYVFHYLGISLVALLLAKPGLLPAPLTYLISLIAGFAAGYLLYEGISRIPFFRWAILGIKKEKKPHVQGQSDSAA